MGKGIMCVGFKFDFQINPIFVDLLFFILNYIFFRIQHFIFNCKPRARRLELRIVAALIFNFGVIYSGVN